MVTEQLQEHDTSGSDNSLERNSQATVRSIEIKQPPGVKELRNLLDKFTRKSGEGDFKAWVEDYVEATSDCGWNNELRFYWFL